MDTLSPLPLLFHPPLPPHLLACHTIDAILLGVKLPCRPAPWGCLPIPVHLHTRAHTRMHACNGLEARLPLTPILPLDSKVHAPNSCGAGFCGKSPRGAIGDAVEEMHSVVGVIMAALSSAGVDDNTLVFFTSDNVSTELQACMSQTHIGAYCSTRVVTSSLAPSLPGMCVWRGRGRRGRVQRRWSHIIAVDAGSLHCALQGAPLGGDEQGNLPLRDGKASCWEGGFREPGMAR